MSIIESADQATDIAVSFLKQHHPTVLRRPLGARLAEGRWHIQVDVGAFFTRVATVIVDEQTGRILEYEIPPSPLPAPPGAPQL